MLTNKNIFIVVIALVFIGAGVWYLLGASGFGTNNGEVGTEPVATVNGEEITRADLNTLETQIGAQQGVDVATLDEQTQTQIRAQALDALVSQALIRQAAAQADINVALATIDEQVATISSQFQDAEAFERALRAEGLTEEALRESIEADLTAQAYLEQELNLEEISATEEEVAAAYSDIAAGGETPPLEEVHEQVENIVIQQKQQELVGRHVADLRAGANIEILI